MHTCVCVYCQLRNVDVDVDVHVPSVKIYNMRWCQILASHLEQTVSKQYTSLYIFCHCKCPTPSPHYTSMPRFAGE